MGDAGEGLVDAESRLAERMEEREQEKRQARLGPSTADPERARETESLRLATGTSELTLYVNPADYEHLGAQIARLAETICHAAPAQIVADAEISPGGCRITTKYGEIDKRLKALSAK